MVERKDGVTMGNAKPVNAGKPWTEEEMFLVGSYIPTWNNVCWLAKKLGRTEHAIQFFYCKLYSKTTTLKEWAKDDTKTEQYQKILNVRRKLDLSIGM